MQDKTIQHNTSYDNIIRDKTIQTNTRQYITIQCEQQHKARQEHPIQNKTRQCCASQDKTR